MQRTDPVTNVLDQMERHSNRMKLAIVGAAAVEALLMLVALFKMNWNDSTHILMFVFAVLGYTIVLLGLAALGAHVSRVGLRVVQALDHRG
jgi:hypothetical protein